MSLIIILIGKIVPICPLEKWGATSFALSNKNNHSIC
jgi:hypothetical protein